MKAPAASSLDFNVFGVALSGALVCYSVFAFVMAWAFQLPFVPSAGAAEDLHLLALYGSQVLALISLGTGYFEHRQRKVLCAGMVAFGLQAWGLTGSGACCQGFLSWAAGTSDTIDWLGVVQFVCPVAANSLLIWAYLQDHRLRMASARMLRSKSRRSQ